MIGAATIDDLEALVNGLDISDIAKIQEAAGVVRMKMVRATREMARIEDELHQAQSERDRIKSIAEITSRAEHPDRTEAHHRAIAVEAARDGTALVLGLTAQKRIVARVLRTADKIHEGLRTTESTARTVAGIT